MRSILLILPLLLLPSCIQTSELNPAQTAYVVNKEYIAVAEVAAVVVESPSAQPELVLGIQAADAVAFSYVSAVTKQAELWGVSQSENKPEAAAATTSLAALARAAIAKLASFLQ